MKPVSYHIIVSERPQASYGFLYEVGELVTEKKRQQSSSYNYKSFLPTKFPDYQGDNQNIERNPDRNL